MKKRGLLRKFSVGENSTENMLAKTAPHVNAWPGSHLVDKLINFLTEYHTLFPVHPEKLKEFEKLTAEVLAQCGDPELHRLMKQEGWMGAHFQLSIEPPFIDSQSCLNALSNYYLKINSTPVINELSAMGEIDSHNLDQILPFCPDILAEYLKRHPIKSGCLEPRRISFSGACMLADISGFSKFSGAMCSKGVSGLDDLREATNGFLGYFVKQVYEFEGDG
jgi:hypothetical protein